MWFLKKLFKKREEANANVSRDEDGDVVKPFLDHLEDLRSMFLKMLFTLGICMCVAFAFRSEIAHLLKQPLVWAVPNAKLQSINPIETVSMSFRLAFYAGIVVSFPILFYFLAEFILPALTKKEKRVVLPAVGIGFGLFLAGVVLCFCLVLPPTLRWLNNDIATFAGAEANWTLATYYALVTNLCVAMGLIAEMPVVVVTLNAIGLVSAKWLRSMRIYGYAASLILAGLIAPTPDFFMLATFALPMMLLFEGCIWLIWWLEKRREKREAVAEARALMDPNEPID
jgi:sec-independent protein translocase protein TatC